MRSACVWSRPGSSQVHGTDVAVLPAAGPAPADAAVTFTRGQVCAVLVADCLPVFLASRAGDRVGIAHAGWRGLAAGVVEATIAALACEPGNSSPGSVRRSVRSPSKSAPKSGMRFWHRTKAPPRHFNQDAQGAGSPTCRVWRGAVSRRPASPR